jgi:hypothetical protein
MCAHSTPADFGTALLLSLDLQHSVVISTVFDELEKLNDISALSNELIDLSAHPLSSIREGVKRMIFKASSATPRSKVDLSDPVGLLQSQIEQLKTSPAAIQDPSALFSSLLDQYESVPTDPKHVRLLLKGNYVFLSEPTLSMAVTQKDLLMLVHLLCGFSLHSQSEFLDALNAIGFVIVTVVSQVALFDSVLQFFDEHIDKLDRKSFPFQLFSIGISLLAVGYPGTDLGQLRAFAKSVIARGSLAKDDLRAVLCRSLLAEIVSLEQQKLTIPSHFDLLDMEVATPPRKPAPAPPAPPPADLAKKMAPTPASERYLLLSILKKLTKSQTRAEGIAELLRFDESGNEDVVGVIVKLMPALKKEIDDLQKIHSRKKAQ